MIAALDVSDGDADSEDGDNDCCSAADDDPSRHLFGTDPNEADAEGGTWEHHGERQPNQINVGHHGSEDFEPDENEVRQRHVDRIRRTRCNVYRQYGMERYVVHGRRYEWLSL